MSANEIAERLAAACWVQCGSVGGESIADLDPAQIRYRSYVGFQNRIITTTDATLVPLLVLPLDRTFSRDETALFVHRHGTVGPNDDPDSREAYPLYSAPAGSYAQVFASPIMLSWLGPDFSSPLFMPFGLDPGPVSVPVGQPLNTFDAIAVLLPVADGDGFAGDFSVLVLKHPKIEGVTTIEAVLPVFVGP